MNLKKISPLLILLFTTLAFAEEKGLNQFDMFDNRFYINAGANFGTLQNHNNQTAQFISSNMGLGVEKLFFDSRIWLNAELGSMMSYHELDNNLSQEQKIPLAFDPKFYSLNLKLGRAFQIVDNSVQITPYALVGKNGNMTPYSLSNTAIDDHHVKYITSGLENFFWTTGIGGRLEYAVAETFDFYLDENLNYNLDNSHVQAPNVKLNNLELMNTIGAKWQAVSKLQFAIEGYYRYQQYTLSVPQEQDLQYNPLMDFGTRLMVGMTF